MLHRWCGIHLGPPAVQNAEYKHDRVRAGENADVCDNLLQTASQIVDFKDGEMSEWLKEHAWKTTPATLTE